jgi:uncharacterized membrane protein YfhO
VTERSPGSLEVLVRSQRDAFLVLSEVFYPGWEARLDGREVEILCANYIFRAVLVPRGEHTVSLRYRPRSVLWGALLTGVFVVLTIIMLTSKRKI